jgi:hypothetical protein
MLRREKLWSAMGSALVVRSKCYMTMGNLSASNNDLLAAVEVFGSATELEPMCDALLELAENSVLEGDWATAKIYASRIVEQVLMSFTSVHNQAMGILAICLAREGSLDMASELVGRLGEVKGLSGAELAHLLHAQTLLATGVRQRNLAAKAVKEYLLLRGNFFMGDLVALM